jgi:hypothetical protein
VVVVVAVVVGVVVEWVRRGGGATATIDNH